MSERTGLGVVEIAILEAVETTRFLRCSKALASVEERTGLAPGYGYEVLVDLARSWTMPVSLVHGQGNFGSRGDDPPANFSYTEARITRAGRVVLAAERGEMAPVPIALINGNTYREGLRPPFCPGECSPMGARLSRPSSHHPPSPGQLQGRDVRTQPFRPAYMHPQARHLT